MRVLYILDSLTPGGTERSTVMLIPWLRDLGVDVAIAIFREDDDDLRAEAIASGARVHLIDERSLPERLRSVRRLIRSERPDIVHTALYKADQIGRLASLRTGIPVVSSFVNTPYDKHRLRDPNVSRWKLRVAQAIDFLTAHLCVTRFHAVSLGAKDANCRALRVARDRTVIAERGRNADELGSCSITRRNAVRQSLGLSEHAEVVLNIGRLDEQKGQRVLIDAVGRLSEDRPGLVTLIAGKNGSATEGLRGMIESDPILSQRVQLLGHRADVGDLLCAADVLVISSYFEGTAGAAIEAMAVGTPIISTAVIGAVGILEHERNAILVPIADSAALGAGISLLLDDEDLAMRLSENAGHDYEERFTMSAAATRLFDLYHGMVADRE